jgi:type I restriction enzyme M protein
VVEQDLIECVVALPEKIFYNTGSPGCLIFLNYNKLKDRQGKVLFIYAGKDFEKLKNMNKLRDEDIAKAVGAYSKFADIPKYAKVVSLDKIKENDCNLSVARYVDVFEEEETIDVSRVWNELTALESERKRVDDILSSYLRELGYDR